MAQKKYVVEIEKAKEATDRKPSVGPVYRNVLAKDGFRPPVEEIESCWDVFRVWLPIKQKKRKREEKIIPFVCFLGNQTEELEVFQECGRHRSVVWDERETMASIVHSLPKVFGESVENYPNNQMLAEREVENGKAGKYVWLTYKEVYDIVLKVGASIRSCGVKPGAKCGIYGANCPKWVISMQLDNACIVSLSVIQPNVLTLLQACNAHRLLCVPLYDTLGAGAVKFIICHAEISIAFADETKISEVLKTFPDTHKYLKTLVSFGKVTAEQREVAETFSLTIYSWDEFLLLETDEHFDLPIKKKSDLCTIMYTSGTTGDPKGVMISNASILSIISGVNHHLQSINEEFTERDVYMSYLPLAHIFDRVIEELFLSKGASIGFWQGDVKLLMDDIRELKPTAFCAVPRVLDRIYS
ncbi:unnamed protein product, partial [Ilex paraguariensis]